MPGFGTGSSREQEWENMAMPVAGIDVGKDKLDIHLGGEDRTLPNDRDGLRAIARWFRAEGVDRVVLEATGRVHRSLVQS